MEQSRLRLEHYNLQRVSLQPVDDVEPTPLGAYANFAHAKLGSKVVSGVMTLANDETRHTIELTLTGGPKEPGAAFPYQFEIGYIGIFDGRELPDAQRENLVMVNGTSMLYGIARETLLGLTTRSEKGAMLLPSVHFAQLAQQGDKEAAEAAQAALAEPKASGAGRGPKAQP